MHPALQAIKDATAGTPFEGELWLVGGAVRDELLGIPHEADFDIVLQGSSEELAQLLYKKKVSGIRPVTYERFGTAMVMVRETQIELVTARRESYEAGSRKPLVEPASLQEDALRRDFTVNTLMRNLHSWELLDPLGKGLDDLKGKVLQTPLDPIATFHDDPLRMLRAVRFRWKLGFIPAKGLYGAIKSEAARLQIISGERIRDELIKMLLQPTAPDALRDLMDLGLFEQFAPELPPMVGLDQGPYHHLDAWEHSLLVLSNVVKTSLPPRSMGKYPQGEGGASELIGHPGSQTRESHELTLRLAALLHDVGKPKTHYIDFGRIRTTGHEEVGAEMAEELLRRLKFPVDLIDDVTLLIRNHSRLGYGPDLSPSSARRVIRDLGDLIPPFLDLVQADRDAHKPGIKTPDLTQARQMIDRILQEAPREMLDSPLEGGEIMELLKLTPGPEVGKWKRFLTEQVLDGKIAPGDKAAAQAVLLRAVAESSAS
jgi:poly(A) polymerase